jgi:hypothetical protein
MLISVLTLVCLGFAWAVEDSVFAAVFAIEAAVAGCESVCRRVNGRTYCSSFKAAARSPFACTQSFGCTPCLLGLGVEGSFRKELGSCRSGAGPTLHNPPKCGKVIQSSGPLRPRRW